MTTSLLRGDLRFALRALAARPGWTTAALVCLAIATGANTAAFTIVNGFVLRPLPFTHPDRLVMVALREPAQSHTHPFSLDEYRALAHSSTDTAALLAWTFYPLSLTGADGSRMAEAQLVSSNYFAVLGIAPYAGRFFDTGAKSGDESNVVLSYDVWRRRFQGDLGVIGRSVRVNGLPVTVIGIAPSGFVGAMRLIAADVWLPAKMFEMLERRAAAADVRMFGVMGRLVASATTESAAARLDALEALQARSRGVAHPPAVVVIPAAGFGVPPAAEGSAMTLSALIYLVMGLLLAVAAANVAALVLSRGAERTQEVAVRLALGASRWDIARQLLAETSMLAAAGNALGAVAAVWLTRLLAANLTSPFVYVSFAIDVTPDVRVFAYCVATTLATTALCGLAPLGRAARVDTVDALKRSGRAGAPGPTRLLRGTVVAQFATCTALLMATALLVGGYVSAQSASPGFNPQRLAAASLDLKQIDVDESAGRRLYARLIADLSRLSDVSSVSLSDDEPFGPAGRDENVKPLADRAGAARQPFSAAASIVGADYFRTLDVPIAQGRGFRPTEAPQPLVAIVNETMAQRVAGSGSAIGQVFRLDGSGGPRVHIVGVVADLRMHSLGGPARPAFYQPFSQRYGASMTLLLRTRGDPASISGAIDRAVHDASPNLAIVDSRPVGVRLEAAAASHRDPAMFLLAVSMLGLLLSSVGLYGVVSYAVRQRARELAIRLALGARPLDVRWMVLRQGLGMIVLGLATGGLASVVADRLVRATMFGAGRADLSTVAVVFIFLMSAGVLALYVPARWASRLDPAQSLRAE
jgi:predicted permease